MEKNGQQPVVALAMPRRGQKISSGAAEGFYLWPSSAAITVIRMYRAQSLLDHCFNSLWCNALNLRAQGVTHFAMIHDDVCPQAQWLDVLLAELAATQADVISAVIPIKTEHGVTSTAVETDDVWFPRRLTVTETDALPETFTDEDVGGELLLNTGLWLCDLRRSWTDNPWPLHFQTLTRIITDREGNYQAQVRSEDWEFSRRARGRGARLAATRKVAVAHDGEMQFRNRGSWGEWATDEAHKARLAEHAQGLPEHAQGLPEQQPRGAHACMV